MRLLHRKNSQLTDHPSNLFDAFNDSIDAFDYEYDAVAKPPPYWKKHSRHKWSFSLIYKRITKKVSCMSSQNLTWLFEKFLSAQDFLLMIQHCLKNNLVNKVTLYKISL